MAISEPGDRTVIRAALARGGLIVLVLLTVLVTYQRTLQRPLGSDARFLTYQNAWVRDPGGIPRFWTGDFFEGAETHGVPYLSGYYRPVTNLWFWLEYRVARENNAFYNVTEVLLHGVVALLVVALCRRLGAGRPAAWLAGVLFAVHPVHAVAATEPAARSDVLFTAFFLLSLLAFDRALEMPRLRAAGMWLGLTAVLYLMAVLSKEMGITLPAVLCLMVGYRHLSAGLPLKRLWWTAPAWGVFAGYLLWRFVVLDLPSSAIGYGQQHASYVLTLGALKGIVIHLSRLVVPLGPEYPELNPWLMNYLARPFTDPLTYAALVVVAALAALALAWRRHAGIAFWAAFFLVTYSPLFKVENIAGTMDVSMLLVQERWIYLPSVAVFAVVGHLSARGLGRVRGSRRRTALAAATASALVLLMLLVRTAGAHAGRHDDPLAQLRRLYLVPEDRLTRVQEANRLITYAQWVAVPLGHLDDAEGRARRAVELMPDSPIPAVALANVLVTRGKGAEAIEALGPWRAPSVERLIELQRTNYRVGDDYNRVNGLIVLLLARAYTQLGEGQRAMGLLCEAVRRRVDGAAIAAALREAYAPRGQLPDEPLWTPPFSGESCPGWARALQP